MFTPVWTQVHTALFASVEAGGSVQLWDLNTNTEVPAAICNPDNVACLNKVTSACSSKLSFNDIQTDRKTVISCKLPIRSLGPQMVWILQLETKKDRCAKLISKPWLKEIFSSWLFWTYRGDFFLPVFMFFLLVVMFFFQLVVLEVSERLANPGADVNANLTHSLQEMRANKDV